MTFNSIILIRPSVFRAAESVGTGSSKGKDRAGLDSIIQKSYAPESDAEREKILFGNERNNELALNMIFSDSVIQKALNVLEYFMIMRGRITVLEVAEALGLTKATAHRIVNELKIRGYLAQDSDKSYYATLKMMMVGTQAEDCSSRIEVLMPYLIHYAQRYHCCAGFSMFGKLNSNCHVYAVNFDPAMQLPMFLPGKIHPMHCTSSGKIKLSAMTDQQIDAWLDGNYRLIPYTSKTIIERSRICAEIRTTRERGYAVDNGEYHAYIGGVSVPLFNGDSRIVGALNLSVPLSRLKELDTQEVIEELKERMQKLPPMRLSTV